MTYEQLKQRERKKPVKPRRPVPVTLALLTELRTDDVPWSAIAARYGYTQSGIRVAYARLRRGTR